NFFFNFSDADIASRINSLPSGNAALHHAEWYQDSLNNGNTTVAVNSVDNNGNCILDGSDAIIVDIKGTINIDYMVPNAGAITAIFDERYQEHYVADSFGTHTPILMTYEMTAPNIYEARPYSTAGGLFYRDPQVTAPNGFIAANLVIDINVRHSVLGYTRENHPNGSGNGDHYNEHALEVLEMIPLHTRYYSNGTEASDGDHVYDSYGNIHPIRSRYVKCDYDLTGIHNGSTFPLNMNIDWSKVLATDFSSNGTPMTLDDYIKKVRLEIKLQIANKPAYSASFYSGPSTVSTFTMPDIDSFAINGREEDFDVIITPINSLSAEALARNKFGLKNMHGNVAEWVDTKWDGISGLPVGNSGDFYVTRGGSWKTGANQCRSAARIARDPGQGYDDVGFRFILTE
ncbi:MAG: SUMF1/EgtB/PvdO family nonheme iron enzyme, partial [Planctomycetes bacterium]|nr:SUMF1/EgtB/PvdO family nonheme iron enzyme [Planctomycetota bacterium]